MSRFKLRNNIKGFTLIELVAVIAILGIISAIAIPKITDVQNKARLTADESNRTVLISAANIAIAENGHPNSEISWTGIDDGVGDFSSGKYLDKWPSNPLGKDKEYVVKISTGGKVTIIPAKMEE